MLGGTLEIGEKSPSLSPSTPHWIPELPEQAGHGRSFFENTVSTQAWSLPPFPVPASHWACLWLCFCRNPPCPEPCARSGHWHSESGEPGEGDSWSLCKLGCIADFGNSNLWSRDKSSPLGSCVRMHSDRWEHAKEGVGAPSWSGGGPEESPGPLSLK